MLPSNWYENSACNGCNYGERITAGVFCNRIQELVPVGYVGCKARKQYSGEIVITLTELAQELRKIFKFRYLTVEKPLYSLYFCMRDQKPHWTGEYWDTKNDGDKHIIADFLEFELVEKIDLSEYVNETGDDVDFSKCIVEMDK